MAVGNELRQEETCFVRARVDIPLSHSGIVGTFITFNELGDSKEHVAIGLGDWIKAACPLVRIHSECLTGDVFGSLKCDCGPQLHESIEAIHQVGGLLLYLRQEGRGIGLYNKLDAYRLQMSGQDTYEANRSLGFDDDLRQFAVAARMLKALGVSRIKLLTNNNEKVRQLQAAGITVEKRLATSQFLNDHNRAYLEAKNNRCAPDYQWVA